MIVFYRIVNGYYQPVFSIPMPRVDMDDETDNKPITEEEGKHILAMIRGCEPENFELESDAA